LNGEVDAGDYILWRKTLGDTVAKYSGADGSGNSNIGPEDYDVWTANFGNALPAPASGNEARLAEAHAGAESMRASAASMDATKIGTLEAPAIDSVSIKRELPTMFVSEGESLNVALAFASVYGGTPMSSAFPERGSVHTRVTPKHFSPPIESPTTVTSNRLIFDDYGRHFDNFEANNASPGLVWEAVDEVFDTDWANVNASSV
jgi:hypothetical protein